ncbi:MAG: putative ABC transporter permease [Clostridia bacterium]|nr:putative ABC transporter permease [Clostridia bacterium]MCI9275773.1 putative ABC transporter permease [Clostridia bacterium]
MNVFLTLAFLFFIGSVIGWGLELFFRRIISKGEWINPGFLVGPYLPLYGFGLCVFYLLSQINLNGILVILIMMFTVTAIEYIAGLIFIKGMGVKLWDYSHNFGNIDGLICPLYMLLWGVLGAIYYYLVSPYILDSLSWLENNLAFSFFIGFFFGIIVIDTVYSTNLIVKIRKFAREKGLIIRYEELKSSIAEYATKNKEKYSFVFAIGNNVKSIEKHINDYMQEQIKRTDKIKRTINVFINDKVKTKIKGAKNESSNSKSKKS